MLLLEKFNVKASSYLEMAAGVALIFAMVLTCCDIVGRLFRMPIPGTYEIVSFAGGIVIGLTIPAVSKAKTHVLVDLILNAVSPRVRSALEIFNRLAGAVLILLLAYSITILGNDLRASGEVSAVIRIPFYPVAYGIAVALVVEVSVLIGEAVRSGGEENE